jgi:hypothetical protein
METPDPATKPQDPTAAVALPVKEKKKRGRKPKPKNPESSNFKVIHGSFSISFD